MRRSAVVCLVLVTGVLGTSPLWARGGRSDGVVTEHLLRQGYEHLRQAERAHFRKDLENARSFGRKAERVFRDVLAQDPRDARAALLGGQAATFAGDVRSAVEWANRLRQVSPFGEDDPDLHYLRAFIHVMGEQRPERGLRELKRMYVLNPRARPVERDTLWFLALLDHGRNLMKADRAEEAITQFRTGARLARRLGSATKELTMQGNVGVALQRSDRWIEAAELFAALVERQPDNPVWHWQYGLALAAQSKFAEAVPPYREVIRLREAGRTSPGMEDELKFVHLRLGNCLRHVSEQQRNPERKAALLAEAEELMRHFIEKMPEDPLGHKWLGVLLYLHLERPYAALPYFHKAFDLDPACVDSLKYIIQIHEHYPPPPGTIPADDPTAAAAARKAWTDPIEAWKKDVVEGEAWRRKVLEKREKETGGNGCV